MRTFIRRTAVFCGVAAMLMLLAAFIYASKLPDDFNVTEGQTLSFPEDVPVVSSASGTMAVQANLKAGQKYQSNLKLFGVIEVKNVNVSVIKPNYVVPGGEVFGVKLYTEGVMVIGMADVDTAGGPVNPAYNAGIRKGDLIIAVNGKTVNTNSEVAAIFSASDGKTTTASVKRGKTCFEAKITPVLSESDQAYKTGMWVRDSTAGIGTVTYYNPSDNTFGGLGHAVCDVDTGEILPLLSGQAVRADVLSIQKSSKGRTGELEGSLEDLPLGSLLVNGPTGVFGFLSSSIPESKSLPVAMCQQVHTGDVKIISTVDSSGPHTYSARIESVNYDVSSPTKNMVIRITDPLLIAKTGGIVQGMSGSPIIQDGRLVGALTHVFVNDPQHGFGIFAENMLNTSKTLEIRYKSDVS